MSVELATALLHETIYTALLLSAPVLLTAMVSGLLVSVLQAATQVNEQTLSFVPKILVIFVSILLFMPFMLSTLTSFAERMADRIVSLG